MRIALTDKQKERLKVLEPKLDRAIRSQEFETAKALIVDIQGVLRPTKHFVRLVQSKNKFYELAIELNKCDLALKGLLSNQHVLNENTRVYLETISLLAICYLRMKDIQNAKDYIRKVLKNHTVIKTPRTREIFHTEIINRFNEEVALATLTTTESVHLDEEELERESIRIIQTLTNDEIFSQIGQSSPGSTRELIYLVHEFSTKQLPSAERLALPSPDQKVKNKEVGLTVFESVKRVVYNSLCNPESEVYKVWYNNGIEMVLNKGYIRAAIVACLGGIGFGTPMIIASIIALITKMSIEVYCTKYKPKYVADIRKSN